MEETTRREECVGGCLRAAISRWLRRYVRRVSSRPVYNPLDKYISQYLITVCTVISARNLLRILACLSAVDGVVLVACVKEGLDIWHI